MRAGEGRRLLLVHAHPDDETIETGATMARYAAEGVAVTLVTCTRGELGEVIPAGLAHLEAGPGESGEELGQHRIGELDRACAALGVTDHRFLGGPGRWRDSGMMGLASNDRPGCFWQADVAVAAAELLAVIEEVRPQVMVTYDARGFYGHPDHIQAHRVAREAFSRAGGLVRKFYATALPFSVRAEAMALTGDDPALAAGAGFTLAPSLDDLPFGVPDAEVTTRVDAGRGLAAKRAGLTAHATQVAVAGPLFALSDRVAQRILAAEHYTLLAGPGPAGPGRSAEPGSPWEADLFAGID